MEYTVPEVLRSDNGPQFFSAEFDKSSKEYSFTHITSTPMMPQANGEAECTEETVKNALKKETPCVLQSDPTGKWVQPC